ncbi:MAG: efflux RND transporter permease subunit [Planctomycetota bacterium]|nr:efflux RND transporter permease subunit [Planctomycetota bacterium]
MLRRTIEFSTREPILVLLGMIGILVFGWFSFRAVPIDAIPNVGENQVIVLTAWPGRSPKDVEDQITYPLSVSLQAVPGAESVRGKSLFGYSFVQVTFADNVDFYWARSRVLEQLGVASSQLPANVSPQLGPDATGLGQVLYYVLEPPEAGLSLADLRSLQDYVIKFELQSVDGVSEVASIGGYIRQYQIDLDPDKLRFFRIPLHQAVSAIKQSNLDVGAKTLETGGMEFVLRGKGFLGGGDAEKVARDIEDTVVLQRDGIPVRVRDLGRVQLGPDFRRGGLDYNGSEAVGGVVVMRHGENPRRVIARVREKMRQIEPALQGVRLRAVYDRTGLIDETMETLSTALAEEILITTIVVLLFLLHFRSSFIVSVCLPAAVLMSFIAMRYGGIEANIMSLAGIAIAIGTMVDMGIIVAENIYEKVGREAADEGTQPWRLVADAAIEVAPAVRTAVMTTIVSFLPVFCLTGRDYRLFAPLAYTKTFAIAAALIAAVTIVPALSRLLLRKSARPSIKRTLGWCLASSVLFGALGYFVWGDPIEDLIGIPPWGSPLVLGAAAALVLWQFQRERVRSLEEIPTSRLVHWIYAARLRYALGHKKIALSLPSLLVLLGFGAWIGLPKLLRPVEIAAEQLGADFNELPGYVDGKHLLPGLSTDDWIALDEGSWFYMPTFYPAVSFSQAMQILQTQDVLIGQIPEVKDVLGKIGRVESALDPAPAAMVETYVMLKPKREWRPGITPKDIWNEINRAATLPGVTRASELQPIEGRVVMLQSGIKAPMAVRIFGDDLKSLGRSAIKVAELLKTLPQIDPATVNPDIVLGKPYVEFTVDRESSARYGMSTERVNQVIETALGGMNLIQTFEGRERYPVRLRYIRDTRQHIDQLNRLPVVTSDSAVVPLEELAKLETSWGPAAINSENARLVAHVAFSTKENLGVLEAIAAIEKQLRDAQLEQETLALPAGYSIEIVGSFRNQIEANRRLMWIIPLVILINLILIYLQFRNLPISLAVFSGIPVAFAGGMLAVAFMQVELNTAVWVGFIALFGVAVDDGVVMATYIHQKLLSEKPKSVQKIRDTVYAAGLKRIRPCVMTTATTLVALSPVLLSDGRGADVARAMALPVFGGMLVEPLTSFIVPTVYSAYLETRLRLAPVTKKENQ